MPTIDSSLSAVKIIYRAPSINEIKKISG